jgi:asparagine synthase (glutamine-hydrolysing)
MSALCAIVTRDGSAADPTDLQRLFAAARHRGSRIHVAAGGGAAALGVQHAAAPADHVTPGAGVSRFDGLTIAFQGRIDNLAELRAELDVSRPDTADDGSEAATARVILRAFAHWHEGCATRLSGDFAFVIWDAVRRRTYCARDALGVKPLYYHAGPRRFIAATEVTQVLAAGVPLAPCESMVAELLAFDVRSRSETLYRDILRLPAGHAGRPLDECHRS